MRRTWIKLFCDRTLHGTCFEELEPDERFGWFGYLLLAGDSPVDGKICVTENSGYTDNQIAELLKVPLELHKRTKRKCIKFGKIKILENNIIEIINWRTYQSEYCRQKKYRDKKKEESSLASLKEERRENIEKEGGEERREKREEIVTLGCNSGLSPKVTREEELPPIPSIKISYEKIKEFEQIRKEIKRLEEIRGDERQMHYHNLTEEKIREKIEGYIETYLRELKAYQ
jgi:hypothetical protein